MEEITSGVDHLHNLNVVHRDIKPQNILISTPQRTTSGNGKGRIRYRMLISDFGLCKKLDDDLASFLPTTHGALAAGTRGWQAPEILRLKLETIFMGGLLAAKDTVDNAMKNTALALTQKKLTKNMDIFPLGCLFYYTITRGRHPFGVEFEREVNILRNTKDLSGVEALGEEGPMAKDLITRMLNPEPDQR
jgi:serine/threonine-protein kinase/endoribonuclease IRE1